MISNIKYAIRCSTEKEAIDCENKKLKRYTLWDFLYEKLNYEQISYSEALKKWLLRECNYEQICIEKGWHEIYSKWVPNWKQTYLCRQCWKEWNWDELKTIESNNEYKVEVNEYYKWRYHLIVNWYIIWDYICGKNKKYLNPDKWAKEMTKKRNIVIDRNIKRLEIELNDLNNEKIALSKCK